MKTNETELLMKTGMCYTLGSLRRLVVVWEQFHDWFLLKLPVKYYPEKVPEKKSSVGYGWIFPYWETPILVWDISQKFSEKKTYFGYCFSETNILQFVYFLCCCKVKRPLGSSSWKLLELTSVSRFLAYVTRPHEWRISVACGKEKPLWGKKCIQCTHECHDEWSWI